MEKKILSDSEIITLFFSRNDRAITEVSTAYGLYLHSIASNILKNEEDCDECLNDVYLWLWNHIPPLQPDNLKVYTARAVRNAALKIKRSKAAAEALPIDELAEYLESPQNVESEYDAEQLKDTINRFVRSLSEKDRYIFICRYYDNDHISKIAHSLRVSEKSIYKRLSRIKTGLAEKLRKEGFPC